jgi:hypothetical protein
MSTVLAIDPGNVESAYALVDSATCRPLDTGKVDNAYLIECLQTSALVADSFAIEMVASYGMPVGREVFETCVWIGRFQQTLLDWAGVPDLIYRRDVKLHHCQSAKAKDSNITQALVDRFAHNVPNKGKGTKADPGWFYGFRADIWQAYALAVLIADTMEAAA